MTNIENPGNQLIGFDPSILFKNNPGFNIGTGDLFVGGGSTSEEAVWRMLAFLLMTIHDASGKCPFRGMTIIVPPVAIWNHTEDDILRAVIKGAEALRSGIITSGEADTVRRLLNMVRCCWRLNKPA